MRVGSRYRRLDQNAEVLEINRATVLILNRTTGNRSYESIPDFLAEWKPLPEKRPLRA